MLTHLLHSYTRKNHMGIPHLVFRAGSSIAYMNVYDYGVLLQNRLGIGLGIQCMGKNYMMSCMGY